MPEWNLLAYQLDSGVGMSADRLSLMSEDRALDSPGLDVDAGPDRSLVKVRLSPRFLRREAGHRHHGHASEHDHPDVWQARLAQPSHLAMGSHSLFQESLVWEPSARVLSVENLFDVSPELGYQYARSVHFFEALRVPPP